MCPPGTDTAMLDAATRGLRISPAAARSRMMVSKSATPPTVRMVVTPLSSSVLA